jgi:hypothetical protein
MFKRIREQVERMKDSRYRGLAAEINNYKMPEIVHGHVTSSLSSLEKWQGSMDGRVGKWIHARREELGPELGNLAESLGNDLLSKMHGRVKDYLKQVIKKNS